MRAHARVVVGHESGRTIFRTLRSDPPLLLRPTPSSLLLVGGAAGPLGGDDLEFDLVVEAGAHLVVRSAAASLALPGRRRSQMSIRATVAEHATLDFAPEPLVSVVDGDHLQATTIAAADTAQVRWAETTVLGRTGEEPGRLEMAMRVERGGRPLLHQNVRLGPKQADGFADYRDPAVLGGHRAVITEVTLGGQTRPDSVVVGGSGSDPSIGRAVAVPLDHEVSMATATGLDISAAQQAFGQLALP